MSVISKLMQRSLRKNATHLRLIDDISDSERTVLGPSKVAKRGSWALHCQLSEREAFQKGAACVVGFDEGDAVRFRALLRQVGLGPCASCAQVDLLQDLASPGHMFPYLVVNIDAFEDCGAAVTALLSFRSFRAESIVILVSAEVAVDDLGAERRMICDATLRAPVTPLRLKHAVSAAFENNAAMLLDAAIRRSPTPFQ